MNVKHVLISAFIMSVMTAGAVQARPDDGANCVNCHNTTSGRFEVTSEDTTLDLGTQLDGNRRGPLKTFVVSPGETRRLSVNVLNASGTAYLVLSGLERGGQDISLSNHLDYSPDSTWTPWGSSVPYYTKLVSSTGPNGFDLTVNVGTPDDVYDLTFAMAGRTNTGTRWSQQEHFYLQVVSPAPASPIISGNIATSGGAPMAGVSVSAGGGVSDVTDASGGYSLTVSYNWSGTVTPSMAGYTFVPPSTSYSNVTADLANEDYIGTSTAPASLTISGSIATSGGAPIAGVSVSAGGGVSGVTNVSGNYSLTVPYNWSGTVTPSMAGYTFVPASRLYNNVTGDLAGEDYVGTSTPGPTISGVILTSGLVPIAGVSVSANNGGGSGVTNALGRYSLTVPYSWSGLVTPSKPGYTFSPSAISYSNVTGNRTGDYFGTSVPVASPAISGNIATSGGAPMAGVSVSAGGGVSDVTDASGNYSLTVPNGWSGTVTPSMTGYTFEPTAKNYSNVTGNQTNQNYIGTSTTPASLTISGSIATSGGAAMAGVSVSAGGGVSDVTDASGDYSLTVSYNWSGTVTPSMAGYTFEPASRSYSNVTADLANEDYIGTSTTPASLTISGSIATSGGAPIAGVSVSAGGEISGVTNASGDYSLTVSYDWSGTVTPSMAGYTFVPASRLYSNVTTNQTGDYVGTSTSTPSGNIIIIDNDDPDTSSVDRWQRATGGGAYDGDARYCRKRDGMYVYWTVLTGAYEVSMWWPSGPDGLGVTPVLVFDGDELLGRVLVDQSRNGGRWNGLGTYDFRTEARVAIDSLGAGSLVCADAVRFASSEPTVPDYGDGGGEEPDHDSEEEPDDD